MKPDIQCVRTHWIRGFITFQLAQAHPGCDADGSGVTKVRSRWRPAARREHKLAAYARLTDAYFESERYRDFCASSLGHLDEIVLDWVAGPGFDRLLTDTVRSVYPAGEHDQFIAHLRGLTGLWVGDESSRLRP